MSHRVGTIAVQPCDHCGEQPTVLWTETERGAEITAWCGCPVLDRAVVFANALACARHHGGHRCERVLLHLKADSLRSTDWGAVLMGTVP